MILNLSLYTNLLALAVALDRLAKLDVTLKVGLRTMSKRITSFKF